jgi:hypothetical protein
MTKDTNRITTAQTQSSALTVEARLALFDASTRRQAERQLGRSSNRIADRGSSRWKREDLYTRGRTR